MLSLSSSYFIYTDFFTASHIIVTDSDPGIILPGVYRNMLTGTIEDVDLTCHFAQLNEMLHCDGAEDEVIIEQLVNAITSGCATPFTLDVSEAGGVECACLLYCMQPMQVSDQPVGNGASIGECLLRAFIPKQPSVNCGTSILPAKKEDRMEYYLLLLTIRYQFYLHFIQEMPVQTALLYSGLQDALMFHLAKAAYEKNTNMGSGLQQ